MASTDRSSRFTRPTPFSPVRSVLKLNAFVRYIVVSRVECFGFRRSVRPIQTANRGCRVRRRRTKSVRLLVSFAKMPNRGLTNRMYPCETVATPSLTSPFF